MNTCSYCGIVSKGVHKVRSTNIYQCRACYVKKLRHDESKSTPCVVCGKICYAEYRNEKNQPICQACRYRAKHTCWVCGETGTYLEGRCRSCHEADKKRVKNCEDCGELFAYRFEFRTTCRRCSIKRKHRRTGICFKCKKERELSNTIDSGNRICLYCYKKYYMKHTPCEMCGKITFCFRNHKVGKSLCIQCSNKTRDSIKHYCISCGRERSKTALYDGQCLKCFNSRNKNRNFI